MHKFKEKLLSIFSEKKIIALTIILSLILIVSLVTYGKNKSNVFKDEYMNNIFVEENESDVNKNDGKEFNQLSQYKEDIKDYNTSLEKNKIVAEIKGEVIKPDVYTLNEGSIIKDLIEIAGGLTAEADISNINRAKELSNHELIIIKNINDKISQDESKNEGQNIEDDDGKININTADISKLKEIPGIGDIKANSIIMYRESNGNFKSIEELKNIEGIGEKTFEKIKNNIKI